MEWFNEFIIKPIENRENYNIVNTVFFALLAILILYLIRLYFNYRNIPFLDSYMIISALPYSVAGGLIRAIVDAVDKGYLKDGIYDYYQYSFITVTPGIYFLMASVFLFFYILEKTYEVKRLCFITGIGIALFHLFLILPGIRDLSVLLLGVIFAYIPYLILGSSSSDLAKLAYFGQAMDGASTFIGIELLGKYQEKHVLSSFIGDNLGYFIFYLIKIFIVFAIDKYVKKDKDLLLGIAAILGFGIGTRNLARMMMGV